MRAPRSTPAPIPGPFPGPIPGPIAGPFPGPIPGPLAALALAFALACALVCAPAPARSQAPPLTEVDVELLLAVDVSRSMTPAELEIQRRGYAAALGSDPVYAAIAQGLIGRVALAYVEWAGAASQTVIVPWTLIETRADAQAVAERLSARFTTGMRRTSISGLLTYGAEAFDLNEFNGLRKVIDVSGDGPNNMGAPVTAARDAALARGITINGLPLMTRDALSARWGIPDLDIYYARCVIGGPGAFVIPVTSWDQFAAAVRRKLVLEIAGRAAAPAATLARVASYDCQIGEKIWQRNNSDFLIP